MPGGDVGGETMLGETSQPQSQPQTQPNGLARADSDPRVPRTKRIACIICRKRKLRCDGEKPSCGTCSRLGHVCAYDEVRKKSGPKRGYVKLLETRLQLVESQLKTSNGTVRASQEPPSFFATNGQSSLPQPQFRLNDLEMGGPIQPDPLGDFMAQSTSHKSSIDGQTEGAASLDGSNPSGIQQSWEMIGLGLSEPLPPQAMIDDLHTIYFEKIHPSIPMMHKYRYLAAMNLAQAMRPAVCLRYAMWALACSITEKYFPFQDIFYQRARRYIECDEMKGAGINILTIGHCQTWNLISVYEFKMMYFPRAWMSTGRAARLAQMLGLQRVDSDGLEVKQAMAPPRDWTDREERRRTFWAAFSGDRYASISTGWPMTIDEKDILTNLPSTEAAFAQSREEPTMSLRNALSSQGNGLSPHASVILLACLFGRNLTHLHRPEPNDNPEDFHNGEFWKRHRSLNSILESISIFLPDHLRLPTGIKDSMIVFLNMNIHTSTICLHQAAILKAEKHGLGHDIISESTGKCFMAAKEIVSIMNMVTHVDIGNMHPFMSFCLFVGARIYAHAYKKKPDDVLRSELEFLLKFMQAMRKKSHLTASFLNQLMVELDGCGLEKSFHGPAFSPVESGIADVFQSPACPAVLPRHSQTQPSYQELQQRNMVLNNDFKPSNETDFSTAASQFSFSTFDIPARSQRHSSFQTNTNVFNTTPPTMPAQSFASQTQQWTGKFPLQNDNVSLNTPVPMQLPSFDTDMHESSCQDTANASERPTPANSHQGAGSTSSYSPPILDGNESDVQQQHQQQHKNCTGNPSIKNTLPRRASYVNSVHQPPIYQFQTTADAFPLTPDPSNSRSQGGGGESFVVPNWDDAATLAMDDPGWVQMMNSLNPDLQWNTAQGEQFGTSRPGP